MRVRHRVAVGVTTTTVRRSVCHGVGQFSFFTTNGNGTFTESRRRLARWRERIQHQRRLGGLRQRRAQHSISHWELRSMDAGDGALLHHGRQEPNRIAPHRPKELRCGCGTQGKAAMAPVPFTDVTQEAGSAKPTSTTLGSRCSPTTRRLPDCFFPTPRRRTTGSQQWVRTKEAAYRYRESCGGRRRRSRRGVARAGMGVDMPTTPEADTSC